jgi:hypothetical protein
MGSSQVAIVRAGQDPVAGEPLRQDRSRLMKITSNSNVAP